MLPKYQERVLKEVTVSATKIPLKETHRKQAILTFCSNFARRFVNFLSKVRSICDKVLQDQIGQIVGEKLEAQLGYKVQEGSVVNMATDL